MLALGLATSPVNAQAESSDPPKARTSCWPRSRLRSPVKPQCHPHRPGGTGHAFRYGSFQFRPDGALVGVEIVLRVDGEEHHNYVEFVSETCVLRIKKAEGLVMEGC